MVFAIPHVFISESSKETVALLAAGRFVVQVLLQMTNQDWVLLRWIAITTCISSLKKTCLKKARLVFTHNMSIFTTFGRNILQEICNKVIRV